MNATPAWGLDLPGWDGRLPAPPFPRMVGRKMFDVVRDPGVIDRYLRAAYVRMEAYDGTFNDGFRDRCSGGDEEGGRYYCWHCCR